MRAMPRDIERDRAIEREVRHRLRRLERRIGEEALRLRTDTGATKARVASVAGVDRTFIGRIESGNAHPSLETLVALATAMAPRCLFDCMQALVLGLPIGTRRGWWKRSCADSRLCGVPTWRSLFGAQLAV